MSTPQNSSVRSTLIWVLPIFIMLVAVVLIALSLSDKDSGAAPAPAPTATEATAEAEPSQPAPQETQQTEEVTVEEYAAHLQANRGPDVGRRDAQDLVSAGPINAPVVMVVFSDYQCKFCSLWTEQTLPVLIEQYVDSGQLRIEWRDVNVFGEHSQNASIAGHAAAAQGKFWQMHAALFPQGETLSANQLTPQGLTQLAGVLGLDTEQFAADLESETILSAVAADEEEGRLLGVSSTPSFLVNGMPLRGAQPAEVFVAVIESELAQGQ